MDTKRTPIFVLIPAATLTVMAGAMIAPVVPQIRAALAVDPGRAGLIITTHSLFVALTSIAAGKVIDVIGPRRPLIWGLLLYGAAGGAGFLMHAFLPLLISRALLGIAVAFVYNGVTVAILSLYQGEDRNRIMGYRGAANSIGGAVWPLIGGALGAVAWNYPFLVYLSGLLFAALTVLWVPETQKNENGRQEGEKDAAPGERSGEEVTRKDERPGGLVGMLRRHPEVLGIYALMLLTNLFLYGFVVFLPQRLAELGVESSVLISFYQAGMAGTAGILGVLYGRIKRRFSFHGIARTAHLPWIAAFFLAFAAGRPLLLIPAVLLYGIGQGLMLPTIILWVDSKAEEHTRGRMNALVPLSGMIGQFLSPVLLGQAVGIGGIAAAFGAAGIAACLSLFILLVPSLYRRRSVP